PTMPGYDQYQRMAGLRQGAVQLGSINAMWLDDASAFDYQLDGKRYRYDVAARRATELEPAAGDRDGMGRGRPERGRQFDSAPSPDSTLKAFYRDRNLWLSRADGSDEKAITTEGS